MADRVGILHLIKGLGPGGAEQLLVQQARCRDRDRFRYEVAYLVAEKDHLVPELEGAEVPVRCLAGRRWPAALRRRLVDDNVDVVHVHSPLLAAAVRSVTRTVRPARRPAVITTEHNRWPRHHRLTRTANRLTIGWDDVTLAVSDDVRASMPASAPVESLTHGIDVEAVRAQRVHRTAVRAELGVSDDEIVVGSVANLRPEKAHDVLLRAAAEAMAGESHLRFVLIGQGPGAEEVHRLHRELALGDRVQLLGYRPDATRLLAGCDVFTLTSRHEGLPVALMEALALGLPVVATRAGGIPQAVAHGRQAVLVDVDDHAALVDAYRTVGRNASLRDRLAAEAGARAAAFDVQRTIARLESIYAETAT